MQALVDLRKRTVFWTTAVCLTVAPAVTAETSHAAACPSGTYTSHPLDSVVSLSSEYNIKFYNAPTGSGAGFSLATTADMNGDGCREIVIGAPNAESSNSYLGAVYVIFGKATPTTVDLAKIGITGNTQGFRINGAMAKSKLGYSVSDAGDINRDGRGDIVLGAPYEDRSGLTDNGSVYVIFGRSSTSTVYLSSTYSGYRIQGYNAGELMGWSVTSTGDQDGDGDREIAAGAPGSDKSCAGGGTNSGGVYWTRGQSSTSTVYPYGPTIVGEAPYDQAGYSIAGARDISGDGLDEIIIGVPYADHKGRTNSGSAYVLGTGFHYWCLGDDWTGPSIDGAVAYDNAGYSVASSANMNTDGTPEVIVGAPYNDYKGTSAGAAYVVWGVKGLAYVEADLASLSSKGFAIYGQKSGTLAGWSVAGSSDMSGDGYPEVLLGALNASNNGKSISGSAYAVYGRASTSSVYLSSTYSGFRMDGAAAGDSAGAAVTGLSDITGDGRAEALVASPAADYGSAADSGISYTVFGQK